MPPACISVAERPLVPSANCGGGRPRTTMERQQADTHVGEDPRQAPDSLSSPSTLTDRLPLTRTWPRRIVGLVAGEHPASGRLGLGGQPIRPMPPDLSERVCP